MYYYISNKTSQLIARNILLIAPSFSRSESCTVVEGALKKDSQVSVLLLVLGSWASHLTTLKDSFCKE